MASSAENVSPELANSCRMVIAAIIGFMVAAQFVSLAGLEIPYYVTLVGAGYLKLSDRLDIVKDPLVSEYEGLDFDGERRWGSFA
jgi:hypothetical protein